MVAEGADIIDVGGESSRPFSEQVPEEEELRRVVPVIEKLAKHVSVPISIDTTKAEVARQAIEAGASIINDIGALRIDPAMAGIAASYGVPVILMHMQGTPKTMQVAPVYDNLMEDIRAFLSKAIQFAQQQGIARSKIIIDPGIGFGKTVEHNLLITKHLKTLTTLDAPILIGLSRKAFIRTLLKETSNAEVHPTHPTHPAVEAGTQAAVATAVLNGAHIVRVHNVANTYATVKIIDAIKNAGNA
jgi:dihydropteroate synthase